MTGRYKAYPEYKDSGLEWLGEVPEHWEILPLKRLFKIMNGSTPKSDESSFWDGDIIWVTPADLSKVDTEIFDSSKKITQKGFDSCGTYLVPKGALILSTRAPIGTIAIAGVELCTNQGCKSLVPLKSVNSAFFYYMLLINKNQLNNLGRGSTFLEVSTEELSNYIVLLPSIEEKKQIINFLDCETAKIDKLIAKQERLIELLKEKRQAVISHAVTKGLNPNVKMKDSGVEWLGEVPEHWVVSKLKNYTNQIVDGTHFTPNYKESGVPFLRVTDVTSKEIDLDRIMYISVEEHNELTKRCRPEKGDLLLSKNGTIGVPKVIDWEYEFSIFVSLCLIKCKPILLSKFAYYVFSSHQIKEQINAGIKQSTVINLHLDKIENFYFPIPLLKEQEQITNYLDYETVKIDKLIAKQERLIELSKERKVALISASVTGKIDLGDWKLPIETAQHG